MRHSGSLSRSLRDAASPHMLPPSATSIRFNLTSNNSIKAIFINRLSKLLAPELGVRLIAHPGTSRCIGRRSKPQWHRRGMPELPDLLPASNGIFLQHHGAKWKTFSHQHCSQELAVLACSRFQQLCDLKGRNVSAARSSGD